MSGELNVDDGLTFGPLPRAPLLGPQTSGLTKRYDCPRRVLLGPTIGSNGHPAGAKEGRTVFSSQDHVGSHCDVSSTHTNVLPQRSRIV